MSWWDDLWHRPLYLYFGSVFFEAACFWRSLMLGGEGGGDMVVLFGAGLFLGHIVAYGIDHAEEIFE